eukprot:1067643-Pyramimonas_sp.AAC.1
MMIRYDGDVGRRTIVAAGKKIRRIDSADSVAKPKPGADAEVSEAEAEESESEVELEAEVSDSESEGRGARGKTSRAVHQGGASSSGTRSGGGGNPTNRRISVYWPLDKEWYNGVVVEYLSKNQKVRHYQRLLAEPLKGSR